MLFLGTEKYPDADEYQTFIAQHGGSRNIDGGILLTSIVGYN
jgi:hypothetical protein